MKRRDWLRWGFHVSSAVLLSGAGIRRMSLRPNEAQAHSGLEPEPLHRGLTPGKWPILQGATQETSVQFSIVFQKDQEISVEFLEEQTGRLVMPSQDFVESREYSKWAVRKLAYAGLVGSARYRLKVQGAGGVDEREVSLLAGLRGKSRVAVLSCIEDTGNVDKQRLYWRNLLAQKPEVLFLIGDHVYVDQGKSIQGEPWEQRIWRRYAESRLFHELYFAPKLVPVLATWDDHDFGENNADGSVAWKEEARRVFEAFFAQSTAPGCIRGPGVASAFDVRGVRWILADDRTWRGQSKKAGETHWGTEQEAWIDQQIDGAPGTTLLCNGSQFFGGYLPGESFEKSHGEKFAAFRARLRERRNRVFLVSGDRHFSELMKISSEDVGYDTYELTSSGFIQIPHLSVIWPFFKNPRRMSGSGEAQNYSLLDLELREDQRLSGSLASISNKGHVIFKHDFVV